MGDNHAKIAPRKALNAFLAYRDKAKDPLKTGRRILRRFREVKIYIVESNQGK